MVETGLYRKIFVFSLFFSYTYNDPFHFIC